MALEKAYMTILGVAGADIWIEICDLSRGLSRYRFRGTFQVEVGLLEVTFLSVCTKPNQALPQD